MAREVIRSGYVHTAKIIVKFAKPHYIDRVFCDIGSTMELNSELAAQLINSGVAININREGK